MNNLLKITNLKTDFRGERNIVHAVRDVSFTVLEGETFGLIGESGCGKSATCRSIINLLKENGEIAGGEVCYGGQDITKLSQKQMNQIRGHEIGMIFQEPMSTLNPIVKIETQLTESMPKEMTREEKRNRAVELLKLVGISDAKQRLGAYSYELSGGMRQRVMIAAALAASPKVLLADEPTTALDVTIQSQILELLMKLKQELGMSMILVTHDLGVAAQVCDRIAVMYAGQIVEIADEKDIFYATRHPYTHGLLCSMPSMQKKGDMLIPIEGMPPDLREDICGCSFAPRCRFCTEKCRQENPELKLVGAGHYSRCFYAETLTLHAEQEEGKL